MSTRALFILYLFVVLDIYVFLAASPRCRLFFAWYDAWVGVFYDRKRRVIYIFLIPCWGIEWQREHRK